MFGLYLKQKFTRKNLSGIPDTANLAIKILLKKDIIKNEQAENPVK